MSQFLKNCYRRPSIWSGASVRKSRGEKRRGIESKDVFIKRGTSKAPGNEDNACLLGVLTRCGRMSSLPWGGW